MKNVKFLLLILALGCSRDLAEKCAETYPCKDSTTYVGIGIPDSTPYIEFVKVPYPETHENIVWRDSGSTKIAYRTELKYKYITRQGVEKIIKVRDTARESYLENKVKELEEKLSTAKLIKQYIPWWVWGLLGLFGLGLIYKENKNKQDE